MAELVKSELHKDLPLLYHYTTMEALLQGIIVQNPDQGKEICLWATHSQYMNDFREIHEGFELIKTQVEKEVHNSELQSAIDEYVNIYSLSFSSAKNSLPMWSMYAQNGGGVMLGFETESLEDGTMGITKCIYTGSEEYLNFRKDIEGDSGIVTHGDSSLEKGAQFMQTIFTSLFSLISAPLAIKNGAFVHENEYRKYYQPAIEEINYRVKDGVCIPYVKKYFPKECLKEIWIGPTIKSDLSHKSLRSFLDSRGFGHVDIKLSEIPYRVTL